MFLIVLSTFLSFVILLLNVCFYIYSSLTFQKVKIQPENEIIAITGCDSGFGQLLAKRFHSLGFKVIAACLTKEGKIALEELGIQSIQCNVTVEEDVKQFDLLIKKELEKNNKLKLWGLINNAGIADGGALDWTEVSVWKRVMEVNFFSIITISRIMLKYLKSNPGSRLVIPSFSFLSS